MLDKEKIDEAVKHLGVLTEEQKSILEDAKENQISEKELYEKLGLDIESFSAFIKEAVKEEEVFSQEVNAEELLFVSGGKGGPSVCESVVNINCERNHYYRIYDNSFPNCNSTVEDGSWCNDADACYSDAIEYVDTIDCRKAWR